MVTAPDFIEKEVSKALAILEQACERFEVTGDEKKESPPFQESKDD